MLRGGRLEHQHLTERDVGQLGARGGDLRFRGPAYSVRYGRNAADVALLTSFGPSRLERFTVCTDEVGEEALA